MTGFLSWSRSGAQDQTSFGPRASRWVRWLIGSWACQRTVFGRSKLGFWVRIHSVPELTNRWWMTDVGREDWVWRFSPGIPVQNSYSPVLSWWLERLIDRHTSGSLGSQLDCKWSVAGGEWGALMGGWVPIQPLHCPRTEQWLERLIGSSQYVFRA